MSLATEGAGLEVLVTFRAPRDHGAGREGAAAFRAALLRVVREARVEVRTEGAEVTVVCSLPGALARQGSLARLRALAAEHGLAPRPA